MKEPPIDLSQIEKLQLGLRLSDHLVQQFLETLVQLNLILECVAGLFESRCLLRGRTEQSVLLSRDVKSIQLVDELSEHLVVL